MAKELVEGVAKQPERIIAMRAVIPAIESAIKVHGDEAAGGRVILDIYPEDLDEINNLLKMRGMELLLVLKEWNE